VKIQGVVGRNSSPKFGASIVGSSRVLTVALTSGIYCRRSGSPADLTSSDCLEAVVGVVLLSSEKPDKPNAAKKQVGL
jgi:hypothetical protein